MKVFYKKISVFLATLIALLSITSICVYADEDSNKAGSGYIPDDVTRLTDDNYKDDSGSGYIPDDVHRLTDGDGWNAETTTPPKDNPVVLSDEQKQQVQNMVKKAELYVSDNSVGNPVAPPYDTDYTKEMGDIAELIVENGNELLYDNGDASLLTSVNSNFARLITLLENPVINPQFAAYTCYLSFKDNNDNNWYEETDWKQFVEYRNTLYNTLTDIREDYLNIENISLTYTQKKEITSAFFNLLELYNKMTLEDALLGDINDDGRVTITDATEIQKYLAGLTELTEGQKLRATTCVNACNNGPQVSIRSVTELQKYIADYDSTDFKAIQTYNIPPKEIWATHSNYPDPTILNQWKYRNASPWNPIICITKWSDNRLEEIEFQR